MAPPAAARSRSRSQSHSQAPTEASVAAAIKLLHDQLKTAKEKNDQILLSNEILQPVNDILRAGGARRGNATSFQPLLVTNIVSELDDDVCSRLEVPVYNTLLRLFLSTTGCPDVERGVYLLAATLYSDAHWSSSPTPEQDLASIKTEIGRDSLQLLLEFFTTAENPVDLRRWAGLLLVQLLHGSDGNLSTLELGSEDSRRRLGNMLSIEGNEYLAIICGQVIKELLDAGLEGESLWPTGTNKLKYQEFPHTSQTGPWNQRFQTYLDHADLSQNENTYLYFAQNVRTIPPSSSERPGHSTNIVADFKTLTVWSPASGSQFDQFLEISLQDICTMSITSTDQSQRPSGTVTVDIVINNGEDRCCIVNAVKVIIQKISMVVFPTEADNMKSDLSKFCPDLAIQEINSTPREESNTNIREGESQLTVNSSTADTPVVFHNGEAEKFETTISTSQKSRHGRGEKLHVSASTDSPENCSEPEEAAEVPISRQKNNQKKPDTDTPRSRTKGQNGGMAASKPNNESSTLLHQKSLNTMGKAPSNDDEPVHDNNILETVQKAKNVMESSNHGQPSSHTEKKIEKLSQIFPSQKRAVIVGALTIAGGNLDIASDQLINGGQSDAPYGEVVASHRPAGGTSSSNKAEGQFDSASFTSLAGNDASTPKPHKPLSKAQLATSKKHTTNSKAKTQQTPKVPVQIVSKATSKPSKYSLKPKQALTFATSMKPHAKSREKPKPGEKLKPAEQLKLGQMPIVENEKPAKTFKVPGSDLWDIDPTDEEDEQSASKLGKGKKGVSKSSTKASAKVKGATTKKSGKPAKVAPKKRKSAPAVLQKTAAVLRSKRGAAIEASNKLQMAAASDDNIDNIEDIEDIIEGQDALSPQKVKSTTSQNPLQLVPKTKFHDAEAVPAHSPERMNEYLGLEQDAVDAEQPKDSVNIGPACKADTRQKRRSNQPCRQTGKQSKEEIVDGSNSEASGAKYFSSKLGGMLGGISIDDCSDILTLESEQHPRKQPKFNGIPDHTQKDGPYGVSNNNQRRKTSKSLGFIDTVDSLPNDEIHRQQADQMQLDITHNEHRPKQLAISNEGDVDGAAAEPAEIHNEATAISNGQYSSADEAPIGSNGRLMHQCGVAADKPLASDQASDQARDNSNNSTPFTPMNKKKETGSKVTQKRKAVDEAENTPKRRCSAAGTTQVGKDPSNRQSQRPETRVKAASQALNDHPPDTPLVDDRLTRNIQIVNFGVHGAINQGPSSILRTTGIQKTNKEAIKTAESPAGKKMKRTIETLNGPKADMQIPSRPKKRQNINPEQAQEDLQITDDSFIADDNHIDCFSSPSVVHHQIGGNSKPSSQTSRVDQNGSPRALMSAEKVDHFSKASQKLSQGQQGEESKKGGGLDTNQIFRPRTRLASIPKTRISSPQTMDARYVKHRKLGNNQYEGVETKEVVVPEKLLADPFVGRRARHSKGFTERLQAGAVKVSLKSETVHHPRECDPASASYHTSFNAVRTLAQAALYDEQTTLVNSDTELPSSASDLASNSSIGSSMFPLSDGGKSAWDSALRPHYGNLSTVANRLIDEVLIRLGKTEDSMELLVTQYKGNGSIVMSRVTEQRDREKARIVANLEKHKKEMVSIYGEAKKFVNDAEKTLKSSTTFRSEKQWHKEQEDIQRIIDGGRKFL